MKWKRTNPEPTPEQLAAWANGELDRPAAEDVEAWLLAHPDAAEADGRLLRLIRDHPPPQPSERAWQSTLDRIESGLSRAPASASRTPGPRLRLRLIVGLVAMAAAATIGGVLVARIVWPQPKSTQEPAPLVQKTVPVEQPAPQPEDADEPFPVVPLSEVNIISIDAEDADRVVMGQELMGKFDLASPEDIEIVKMEPHPEDGQMPQLHRGSEVPMIVAANLGHPER